MPNDTCSNNGKYTIIDTIAGYKSNRTIISVLKWAIRKGALRFFRYDIFRTNLIFIKLLSYNFQFSSKFKKIFLQKRTQNQKNLLNSEKWNNSCWYYESVFISIKQKMYDISSDADNCMAFISIRCPYSYWFNRVAEYWRNQWFWKVVSFGCYIFWIKMWSSECSIANILKTIAFYYSSIGINQFAQKMDSSFQLDNCFYRSFNHCIVFIYWNVWYCVKKLRKSQRKEQSGKTIAISFKSTCFCILKTNDVSLICDHILYRLFY